jgi:hypothetical protein
MVAKMQPQTNETVADLQLDELPTGSDGRRLVPVAELVQMLNDPATRNAIDVIERVAGRETSLKRIVRTGLRNELIARQHAAHQARLIDLAKRKKEGKFLG